MIEAMVRKMMRDAILRFAKKEGVEPNEISVVIHTKNEHCLPQYYYMVNNVPKKGEDGEVVELNFRKDILNALMDLLDKESKAAYFLSEKFKLFEKIYEDDGLKASNIYLILKPQNSEASDFDVLMFNKNKFVDKFTLLEIFEIG